MSSNYKKQVAGFNPLKAMAIILANELGATFKPNGSTLYWKLPSGVLNDVYFLDSSSNGIWKNPEKRSKVENHFALPKLSRTSSILGSGYLQKPKIDAHSPALGYFLAIRCR